MTATPTFTVSGSLKVWETYDGVKTYSGTSIQAWCRNQGGCLVGAYNASTGAAVQPIVTTSGKTDAFNLTLPGAGTYLIVAGAISWQNVTCRSAVLGTAVVKVTSTAPSLSGVTVNVYPNQGMGEYPYENWEPDTNSHKTDGMDDSYVWCRDGGKNCFEHSHRMNDFLSSAEGSLMTLVLDEVTALPFPLTRAYGATYGINANILPNYNQNYNIFIYNGASRDLVDAIWITFDKSTGYSRIDYAFKDACQVSDLTNKCAEWGISSGEEDRCPPLRDTATVGRVSNK
ncbi:MAG: hypothetical protein HYV63_32325 [Candidatus Schekmanbacteria bacterium]|nr:hypothetical protein [Candidatus Schekmanbacteria bacterium]